MKEEEVKNYLMYQYLVYSVFPLLPKAEYIWSFARSVVWYFSFSSSVNAIKLEKVGPELLGSLHS